ncbi:MAG: FAD-binding oxidoreductase [Proteobacteria bacterium]|nr:FAD-binding oxidoreductase [Pseudomonadota bacterium]
MRTDVIVLGAGIVGLGLALNLQERGRSVVLVDRSGPGEGTSFGNAGLIQREAVMPYTFPDDPMTLIQAALNIRVDAYYQMSSLKAVAPWLYEYWRHSSDEKVAQSAAARAPLFEICLTEHDKLAAAAGATAQLRRGGWLKVFSKEKSLADEIGKVNELEAFGINAEICDHRKLSQMEPHLTGDLIGAVHWKDPYSLAEPLALSQAYAALFEKRGGKFVEGDARSLQQEGDGWSVETTDGRISARDCVVALGPWASDVTVPLGYDLPLGVKRGYHMHYRTKGNAMLNLPVLDGDTGYLIAPMTHGIRLTTGAEFAERDAPPSYVQLERAEPVARSIFPLGDRVDPEPWLGRRPCTPDMVPVMGPAPRHKGLWFTFAHAHHGLTLAGSAGRFMAELIVGETPFCDPAPYRVDRF